jgi:hypothetical protein
MSNPSFLAPTTSWPIHVFVCTVPDASPGQDAFGADEDHIVRWGRLHETREKALSNEF